jgi:outer membrane protein assembly factor BamB
MVQRVLLSMILLSSPGLAQNPGDYATDSVNRSRTRFNEQVTEVRPPLVLDRRLDALGLTSAIAFEGKLLATDGGSWGHVNNYHLYDLDSGTLVRRWEGGGTSFFEPAYSGNVALLGNVLDPGHQGSNNITAVRVSTGETVWTHDGLGDISGRSPLITGSMAIYHAWDRIVAADALGGGIVWQKAVTTAATATALYEGQLHVLDEEGAVHALEASSGREIWKSPPLTDSPWPSHLSAAENFVFVSSSEARRLTALDARTGAVAWEKSVPGRSAQAQAAMALAYGRLYWFVNDNYDGLILCLSPESGETLWETRERREDTAIYVPGWVPEDPCVADGHLFYVNAGRIRVRDAETGSLVWESRPDAQAGGLRKLLVGSEGLIAVCDKQTLFYKHAHREFIPLVAQGGGYRTSLLIANSGQAPAQGEVRFHGADGKPLALEVEGLGRVERVPLQLAGNSAVEIRTSDPQGALALASADILCDKRIKAAAVYALAGVTRFAAESARPGDEATAFLLRSGAADTGIALWNCGIDRARLTFSLLDESGEEKASETLWLATNAFLSRFAGELFSGLPEGDLRGTIKVTSDRPFVALAVRTEEGFPVAAYPIGGPSR